MSIFFLKRFVERKKEKKITIEGGAQREEIKREKKIK